MSSVVITKGMKQQVTFTVYNDIILRQLVDLTDYTNFICAVTENGRLLIEKKYSNNEISLPTANSLTVIFKQTDTDYISPNPQSDTKQRTLELIGIGVNGDRTLFLTTNFYLEDSGYLYAIR